MRTRILVTASCIFLLTLTAGGYAWATGGNKPGEGDEAKGGAAHVAYAYVSNGVLDTTRSVGVVGMTFTTMGPLGVYCFDLAHTPSNVEATSDIGTGASAIFGAGVAGTSSFSSAGCPAGTDGAVEANAFGPTQASFFVLFH
jgi:hypothetical protein